MSPARSSSAGLLEIPPAKVRGGHALGDRTGALDQLVRATPPPWRSWRTKSRAARAIRFLETYCVIPSGIGAGKLMKVRPFQRAALEELLAPGVRTGGLQIPRGNAKSTLWAAVGLWALCDSPDSPQIPLVAFNGKQAGRNLMEPVRTMVNTHPVLGEHCVAYSNQNDRRVWSRWNNGTLSALPAEADALQGLNPTVALVDEAQTIAPDVFAAVMQSAGKRAESLVLAIGTPAPNAESSALFDLRARAADGAPVTWIEHAARPGCALDDRAEWRRANPAIKAGLLDELVLVGELELVTEPAFRMYRLGQWVDATFAEWLPGTAWDDCPHADPPPDGTEIVLALAGTWTSTIGLVGCTLDGALFLACSVDSASDDQLVAVIAEACARFDVRELVVAPRTRPNLVARLPFEIDGLAVDVWPARTDLEVSSSTEFRRAIVEGRVAHEHEPILAGEIAALVGTPTPDGSLRLGPPADGRPVDAARAARMAWTRAVAAAELGIPAIY